MITKVILFDAIDGEKQLRRCLSQTPRSTNVLTSNPQGRCSYGVLEVAILVSLFAVLASVTLPALAQSIGSYRLGSGDKIAISVYGEDGMSVEQRLHDEGVIVYPFLGELQVGGRTVAEVERMITEGLKPRYLVDPRVRVSIAEYRPFFVDGEVESPGGYPYQPGLTVRKAVSLAGGLTERASKRKIDVIREGESESSRVDMNEPLNPGDIVTIQQGFF